MGVAKTPTPTRFTRYDLIPVTTVQPLLKGQYHITWNGKPAVPVKGGRKSDERAIASAVKHVFYTSFSAVLIGAEIGCIQFGLSGPSAPTNTKQSSLIDEQTGILASVLKWCTLVLRRGCRARVTLAA